MRIVLRTVGALALALALVTPAVADRDEDKSEELHHRRGDDVVKQKEAEHNVVKHKEAEKNVVKRKEAEDRGHNVVMHKEGEHQIRPTIAAAEPVTMAAVGVGLLTIGFLRRRK